MPVLTMQMIHSARTKRQVRVYRARAKAMMKAAKTPTLRKRASKLYYDAVALLELWEDYHPRPTARQRAFFKRKR